MQMAIGWGAGVDACEGEEGEGVHTQCDMDTMCALVKRKVECAHSIICTQG